MYSLSTFEISMNQFSPNQTMGDVPGDAICTKKAVNRPQRDEIY